MLIFNFILQEVPYLDNFVVTHESSTLYLSELPNIHFTFINFTSAESNEILKSFLLETKATNQTKWGLRSEKPAFFSFLKMRRPKQKVKPEGPLVKHVHKGQTFRQMNQLFKQYFLLILHDASHNQIANAQSSFIRLQTWTGDTIS